MSDIHRCLTELQDAREELATHKAQTAALVEAVSHHGALLESVFRYLNFPNNERLEAMRIAANEAKVHHNKVALTNGGQSRRWDALLARPHRNP